jgi:hypothetical protein
MLAQFTVGSTTSTLADDTNSQGGGKIAFGLTDFAADSLVPAIPLFRAVNVFKAPRGNANGKLAFAGGVSLANRGLVMTFLKTVYALVNQQGTLVLTDYGVTITCASATLKSFQRIPGGCTGVRVAILYAFEITTVA